MQSKSLLIAVAAFAVTATGVHAYGGTAVLKRVGVSAEQASALEEAHQLRQAGDIAGARDVLIEAEITEETLRALRQAAKVQKDAVHQAVEAGDYEGFLAAIQDTPLADIITSEADFEIFKEAHELRQDGEWVASAELLSDLGLDASGKHPFHGRGQARLMAELTAEQREAFTVAKQGNDRATMQAILDEAGLTTSHAKYQRPFKFTE